MVRTHRVNGRMRYGPGSPWERHLGAPQRRRRSVERYSIVGRGRWDADALRDAVRDTIVEHLSEPDAVLVIDETGLLEQGCASCEAGREYTGSAGKMTNCQIGAFAAYVSGKGHAFLDRTPCLPKVWTGDAAQDRRRDGRYDVLVTDTRIKQVSDLVVRRRNTITRIDTPRRLSRSSARSVRSEPFKEAIHGLSVQEHTGLPARLPCVIARSSTPFLGTDSSGAT